MGVIKKARRRRRKDEKIRIWYVHAIHKVL